MTDTRWRHREDVVLETVDATGYAVAALDGLAGKVDAATYETPTKGLVISLRGRIFRRKRIVPAGFVRRIDQDLRCVLVGLGTKEIRRSPRYRATKGEDGADVEYLQDMRAYYAGIGSAPPGDPLPRGRGGSVNRLVD